MKMKSLFTVLLAVCTMLAACEENPYGPTNGHQNGNAQEPEEKPEEKPEEIVKGEFAEGADISWITQMEEDGQKFYNAEGKETECTELMKEIGFDAIRLRVWVDPQDGWCAKEDVLEKAKRAQELGMRIMIDFHYSDSWADPSKQNPPAAWNSYNVAEMTAAVKSHTSDILQTLKDNGVEVEWVQTGNEVNGGMLWPSGKVQDRSAAEFISFVNAGYDAAKNIYPSVKSIIHVSNGHEEGLFDWFFNLMKLGGARYDIIGMSLYPSWWENGGWCDWKTNVDKCIANIKSMNSKYAKPVMICEIGMPVSEPQMSKEAFRYVLDQTKKIEDCHGIFCWEPQTDGLWKPSSYEALGWNAYDKGAFKNGRPTIALDPFKN